MIHVWLSALKNNIVSWLKWPNRINVDWHRNSNLSLWRTIANIFPIANGVVAGEPAKNLHHQWHQWRRCLHVKTQLCIYSKSNTVSLRRHQACMTMYSPGKTPPTWLQNGDRCGPTSVWRRGESRLLSQNQGQFLHKHMSVGVRFNWYIRINLLSENEDVVGATPVGAAPITSEWSTIPLPTNVRFILEVYRHTYKFRRLCFQCVRNECFGVQVATNV